MPAPFTSLLSAMVLAGAINLPVAPDPPYPFDAPVAAPSEKSLDLQLQQACTTGDQHQITDLLNQGAAIDSVDAQGRTPLFFATAYNQINVIKLLLDKGAKIDIQDAQSGTALVLACHKNNHDIAMALLAKGANCNLFDQTGRMDWPLKSAARNGDVTLLAALIDHKADINRASCFGTPLNDAAMTCQWDAFNFLVSKGADPNIPDSYPDWYRTPLINATRDCGFDPDKALVQTRELLKVGANPNLKSKLGATPLMYACHDDMTEIAQALIDGGADINATDNSGETALTYAGDRGHFDMVVFLKNKGATRLDVHIFPHPKPTTPLPPARAWVLAVGAIYNQKYDTNPYFIGGQQERYKFGVKNDLQSEWDIQDKSSLLQKLDQLTSSGERTAFQAGGARIAASSNAAEGQPNDLSHSLLSWFTNTANSGDQSKAMKESYLKWKDKSGLGLDLCLYVYLVNQGYIAGYIDEKEAWSLLIPLGQKVQQNFASWKELGENFLDGSEIAEGARDPVFEGCVQLLSNPKDSNSPWNDCPWNTNLSETSSDGK